MLTNRDLARYAVQITRRSSSWAHDIMTMNPKRWDGPTLNNSVERFCQDIEEVVKWIRAEHEQTKPEA